MLEGVKADERDAFQIWVNLKILEALHEKMLALNLIAQAGGADPYHRVFGVSSVNETKAMLEEKIHLLQKLAFNTAGQEKIIDQIGSDFLEKAQDTSFLVNVIKEVAELFTLSKILFFFDEAAHTFIPSQQNIFFEIFKLLHGEKVACKAAVYPTVTNYGRNFEVGQDAIVLPVVRFDPGESGRRENRQHFRSILEKRLPKTSGQRKKIFAKGAELDLCIDLSNGNPRALLHILNSALAGNGSLSERSVGLAVQNYVDQALIPYHQSLSKRLPKYASHIRVGLDLLRSYIIPEIRTKNNRKTKSDYQSAFFTVQRDMSPNLKLSFDILSYSGMVSLLGTVKIAGGTGPRYLVNLALMATEKAFDTSKTADAIARLSLTDYREFSSSDSQIQLFLNSLLLPAETCSACSAPLPQNAKFCSECGNKITSTSIVSSLLEESVNELSISDRLKERVRPKFPTVGSVVQAKRDELMAISYIKDVRSRIIKNAADEFISG
ncbi:zinc ribbon domain-containing protein [Chromobacterium phragmitis]|uniref:zinc ribbon domain-containing protein n=1 Tax=Chromobacterium amazonense TaxID=1382803 RepID=UPI0021B7B21E|nr:zinc ribbon domain-containing protein [Chromobacterium amazonense]MBM2886824.1 zinc ribbon domain-containing protein [Chromobacterium amazonense]